MKEDHLCLLKANNREQELQFLNLAAAFFFYRTFTLMG